RVICEVSYRPRAQSDRQTASTRATTSDPIVHRLPQPGVTVRRAHHAFDYPLVAARHAFVVIRPTTRIGTSAHAICGLILTSQRVHRCCCRCIEGRSNTYEG